METAVVEAMNLDPNRNNNNFSKVMFTWDVLYPSSGFFPVSDIVNWF